MQTANAWVEINDLHDNVQIKNITPAEALVTRKLFGVKIAGQAKPMNPITHLDINSKEVTRTKEQEYARLVKKYGDKKISEIFPGENPNIPDTFKEVNLDIKGKEPEKGDETQVTELAKLSPEETTDEESVAELLASKLRAKALEDRMTALTEQVAQLLKAQLPVKETDKTANSGK